MEIEIIILALLFSAFFSGIEIAFVTANKLRIELSRKKGSQGGKILADFIKSPSQFLGTTLVGNNIALIVLGITMARLMEPYLMAWLPEQVNTEFFHLLIQTLVTTMLVLLVSEFLPKVLFRINPNGILTVFAIPLWVISWLLKPIALFCVGISRFLLVKAFRIPFEEEKPVFTKVDLQHFLTQAQPGTHEEDAINRDIFEKALHLTKVDIRECMVPRPEIEAIDVNDSSRDLPEKIVKTKLSKIIIYEESIDNILGYVHHHALLKRPESIREVLIPIRAVPESMQARILMNHFIKDRRSIAWVVDEFGGTAGIVTLEDILEEIFGEIVDEHDEEEFIEEQIAHDEYVFSGRLEIDYINEKYELGIPEGEYETLAGFIVTSLERIPEMDEEFTISPFHFTALSVSDRKIETVKLHVLKESN